MTATPTGKTIWYAGVHVCALVAVVLVLWRAAGFLRVAAVALIIAAALESPVAALARRGWRRGIAIALVALATLAVIIGAVALVATRVAPQVSAAVQAAPDALTTLEQSPSLQWARDHEIVDRAVSQARQRAGAAANALVGAVLGLLSFSASVVSVVALSIFLLVSGPSAWEWALKWFPPRRRTRVRSVARSARAAVAGYVAGTLAVGLVAGVVTAVTTGLLGVRYFLALSLLTALLGIIPFVGAIVSGVIVVAVTFLTSGATAGIAAAVVFVIYQQVEGTLLQPLVQRHTIALNPLVVIFAVLFGMAAGGVFGGVIALPIAAAGNVIANDALARRRTSYRAHAAVSGGSPPAVTVPH